jgi:hypothetical protein
MESVTTASAVLTCVALSIALAACAGLRACLPLFLAGALARFGLFTLGPSYAFLSSTRALVIVGIAALLEMVADKVPALDHALDVAGTVLRPAAGALLAASVFGRITDPMVSLGLGIIVGAPAALVPHAAKSGLRAASTVATLGFANPLLSVFEDFFTLFLFALAVLAPILVLFLVFLCLALLARRAARRPREAVPEG